MPSEYHPLPSQSPPIEYIEDKDIEQDTQATSHAALPHSWRYRVYLWALLVSLFVNLLQWTIGTQHSAAPHTLDQNPQWFVEDPLFSPAQDAVKYEPRIFNDLLAHTIYHGPPTNETDKAWEDLYRVSMTRINTDEAALIPNRTDTIPGDEEGSVIILNVFHQLHCLNTIRKALSPERYGTDKFIHIDHCVNLIRESLMCSGDIAPMVFQWDQTEQRSFPQMNVLHTCRNWESLTGWAKERALPQETINTIIAGHYH